MNKYNHNRRVETLIGAAQSTMKSLRKEKPASDLITDLQGHVEGLTPAIHKEEKISSMNINEINDFIARKGVDALVKKLKEKAIRGYSQTRQKEAAKCFREGIKAYETWQKMYKMWIKSNKAKDLCHALTECHMINIRESFAKAFAKHPTELYLEYYALSTFYAGFYDKALAIFKHNVENNHLLDSEGYVTTAERLAFLCDQMQSKKNRKDLDDFYAAALTQSEQDAMRKEDSKYATEALIESNKRRAAAYEKEREQYIEKMRKEEEQSTVESKATEDVSTDMPKKKKTAKKANKGTVRKATKKDIERAAQEQAKRDWKESEVVIKEEEFEDAPF